MVNRLRQLTNGYPPPQPYTAPSPLPPRPIFPFLNLDRSKLADLEAEAREMGATVPPLPSPAMLAKLTQASAGRGGGGDALAGGHGPGR